MDESRRFFVDDRFRGKGLWIALGALALIFLCVIVCGLGALALAGPRSATVYVPPAGNGDGGALPPGYYQVSPLGAGPLGWVGAGIGWFFRLLFFGLFFLLLLRLLTHLFWRHRHWRPHPGPQGESNPAASWGPWARHHYHGRPCPSWRGGSREPEPRPGDEGEAAEGSSEASA